MNSEMYIKRVKYLWLVIFSICIALIGRLCYLQIYPSKVVVGEMQNHQTEDISDMKYEVLDTNGNNLLNYKDNYIVVIDSRPFKLNNYEETFQDLMALNYIMKEENKDFNYSDIMQQEGKLYYSVSEENCEKVSNLKNIKGVYTYKYKKIDKTQGWSVGNILSDIGNSEPGKDTLQGDLYQYLSKNTIPKIQVYLDEKSEYTKKVVDLGEEKANLKLTINKDWNEKVQEILKEDKYSFLKNVGVVMIEAKTGKIRVMAQKDDTQANINLGIEQLGYEPGSIFKTITLSAGLDQGKITTNSTFTCTGEICSKNGKPYSHGTLTVQQALNVSCNDIFAHVGELVGYDKLMDYNKKMGLYQRVLNLQGKGINEATGTMPTPENSMNNISIGQCQTVTPVQMAGVMGTIANNGIYVKPTLVESIVDTDNNIIKQYEGQQTRVFSETTSKIVQQSMKEVIAKGSGFEARVDGVDEGGKTGTSTGSKGTNHGWFAGYFIKDGIKYGLVVLAPNIADRLPNGRELGGGDTGAPIFADIIKALVKN